jgi:hypothetical protein
VTQRWETHPRYSLVGNLLADLPRGEREEEVEGQCGYHIGKNTGVGTRGRGVLGTLHLHRDRVCQG